MADYGIRIWGSDGQPWIDSDDLLARLVDTVSIGKSSGSKYIAGINTNNAGYILIAHLIGPNGGYQSQVDTDSFWISDDRFHWSINNDTDEDYGYALIYRYK